METDIDYWNKLDKIKSLTERRKQIYWALNQIETTVDNEISTDKGCLNKFMSSEDYYCIQQITKDSMRREMNAIKEEINNIMEEINKL